MAPKKSVPSESSKAKKDSNATFESKSVFNITELREGLAKRWSNERFRSVATQRLRRLDIQWDNDTKVDASESPPTRVQKEDVVSATDGEKWNQKKRRLGSTASRSDGTTALHHEIATAVIELKDALPPKPWHDTMRFVSFDIPKTAKEFEQWIEMLVSGKEADEKCVEGIFSVVPSMRNHPDTEMYLREMILPFRSFYVAHIIAHVLQLRHRKVVNQNDDDNEDDASHIKRLEDLLEAKGVDKTIYKSQKHAALHSSSLEDVLTIEAFLPDDRAGLKRHWEAMRKKSVARYAEYHLLYLNSTDEDSDELWVARMRPLAEAGLAHAQFDLGLCLLAQKRHEEGCMWLERAANLGHTKAMSELGRYYFGEAMGWNPTAVDGMKLRKKQGTSSQEKASKIRQDVKSAMKWLETLIDAELWDGETSRDKKDAERMLKTIEADAKKLIEYERAKEIVLAKERKQRFAWILFYCVFGILVAWSLYEYSRPASPSSTARLPVEPPLEDATHVSQHRAFLV